MPCKNGRSQVRYWHHRTDYYVPEYADVSISQRGRGLCHILKHFSVLINPRHDTTLYQISIPQMPTITRTIFIIDLVHIKILCSTYLSLHSLLSTFSVQVGISTDPFHTRSRISSLIVKLDTSIPHKIS